LLEPGAISQAITNAATKQLLNWPSANEQFQLHTRILHPLILQQLQCKENRLRTAFPTSPLPFLAMAK
jgi:hypothetical protein